MSVVVDAKSHALIIAKADVDKLIDDCKLRKCHGVMVIKEDSIIGQNDMDRLVENNISVVRIKPTIEGEYNDAKNWKIIKQAIEDRSQPL